MIIRAAFMLAVLPQLALAFEPALPKGARQMALEDRPRSHYELPLGKFHNGALSSEVVQGLVQLRSWRMDGRTGALTEIDAALASQLNAEGFDIVFRCETEDCGGFDFRFNSLVLPPPDMFVDLSNFRFLSARRETTAGTESVSMLLSRTSTAAMLQVICVTPMEPISLDIQKQPQISSPTVRSALTPQTSSDQASLGDIGENLTERGHVILTGLAFETGSASLADGRYEILEALAGWLLQDPQRKISLVGHTDSKGTLERNTELSQNRAAAVRLNLIDVYNVPPEQLEAQGIGYLAPIASNATKVGRDANRRVEAVLLATP